MGETFLEAFKLECINREPLAILLRWKFRSWKNTSVSYITEGGVLETCSDVTKALASVLATEGASSLGQILSKKKKVE